MQGPANIARQGLVCVLLVVMVLGVFGQVYRFEYVNYDDTTYLTENPYVRTGLSVENVAWAFSTRQASNFFPLTWLSHMLDFQLFGDHAGAHHLVNVLLHAANAVLLFLLLTRMTGALWPSAFVAGLFAVHPLHIESVAWVSARKDVLSTLFWFLATLGYVAYVKRRNVWRYLVVALLLALGLMAKTMLVTLPATLLLLDYWPLARFDTPIREPEGRRRAWKLVLEKAPLFALAAAFAMIGVLALGARQRIVTPFPLHVRAGNALVAYGRYLLLTVWPDNLTVLNPHPGTALPWWQVAVAASFLVMVSVLVVLARRRCPYLIVGWLWYLVTLVPVIGVVQLHGQALAYRYTYVPLTGMFIMAAWGLPDLAARCRIPRAVLRTASAGVLVALMVSAGLQTRHWRDGTTLFRHALDVTPDNPEAHLALGNALARAGKFTGAVAHYANVLEMKPKHSKSIVLDALNNWGTALFIQAQRLRGARVERLLVEAGEKYRTALAIDPENAQTLYYWGNVLFAQARLKEGSEADRLFAETYNKYQAALGINPGFLEALNNWGNALTAQAQTRDGTEADRLFAQGYEVYQAALRIKPALPEALYNWGNALLAQAQTKRRADADQLFAETYEKYRAALHIRPGFREALESWGYGLLTQARSKTGEVKQKLFKKAEERFIQAEELAPGCSSYSIACVKALSDDPMACLTWLERARRYGTLPPRRHLESDPDLDNVRDAIWFKAFLAVS